MAYDYYEDSVVADEILLEFGQAVTLTRSTVAAYSPSTGTAAVTTTTQSTSGAVFDFGKRDVDGVLIKRDDQQLLMSTKNTAGNALTAPEIDESTVTIGGVVYTIRNVKVIAPGGVAVLYDCVLRR